MMQLNTLLVLLVPTAMAFGPAHLNTRVAVKTSPLYTPSTRLQAAASKAPSIPNPFKKLPWNVEKEKQKQARKLKLERASLHRQLGIAEDATYEEIVEATDSLMAAAGDDVKAKIKIEVAKDKILQIRLNERLAGLAVANAESRSQSTYEREG